MARIELRTVISGTRLVIVGILAALCVLRVLLIPDGAAAPRQLVGPTEREIDELHPATEVLIASSMLIEHHANS